VGREQDRGRERKREKERERVESVRWSVAGKELQRGSKNLTFGQIFMRAYRRDNSQVYQDGNKAYPKNF
jgi:hypothetical protein